MLVREGIPASSEGQDGVDVVAACGDPRAARAVERQRPDVVVTDIRMPPTGTDEGIRAASALRASHPDVGVVVLSQYAEPALRAGAARRRLATGAPTCSRSASADRDQLVAAIPTVADGGSVVDPKVVEALVGAPAHAERSPLGASPHASARCSSQIAQGKSNAAIAASLVLTKRAVEKHINSIFSSSA